MTKKDDAIKDATTALNAGMTLANFVKGLLAEGWEFPITEVAVSSDGSIDAYQRVKTADGKLEIKPLPGYKPHGTVYFPAVYTFVDANKRMQCAFIVSGETPSPLLSGSRIVH
jgi:hypothetical protein